MVTLGTSVLWSSPKIVSKYKILRMEDLFDEFKNMQKIQ
jgi:hypothetical protein